MNASTRYFDTPDLNLIIDREFEAKTKIFPTAPRCLTIAFPVYLSSSRDFEQTACPRDCSTNHELNFIHAI